MKLGKFSQLHLRSEVSVEAGCLHYGNMSSKSLFTPSESDVPWKDQIDLYQLHSGRAKAKAEGESEIAVT